MEIRGNRTKWQQTLFLKHYSQDINSLIVDNHSWYTSFLSWTCGRRKNPIFYAPLQRRKNTVYCFAAVCMSAVNFCSFSSQRIFFFHSLSLQRLSKFKITCTGTDVSRKMCVFYANYNLKTFDNIHVILDRLMHFVWYW